MFASHAQRSLDRNWVRFGKRCILRAIQYEKYRCKAIAVFDLKELALFFLGGAIFLGCFSNEN